MLLLGLIGAAGVSSRLATACESTSVQGARRGCIDQIVSSVNTSAECEALCCASSAAHPVLPLPGMTGPGCVAWYHNQWSQCFMCNGIDRHGRAKSVIPAVNTTECKKQTPRPGHPAKVCTTGVVKPTFLPKPPAPPMVISSIGTEANAQYTDGAFNSLRPPTYCNGSFAALNRSTELDVEGWPKMDCQITIFDHRPTHAWAPPMDDPEHRQADYSGTWTLVLTGKATVSLINAVGITLGKPAYDATTNTMTQPIVFAKGGYPKVQNLLVLKFNETRAVPDSPAAANGTGFRNLRVFRPGYGPPSPSGSTKSPQLFTDNWAALMSIFSRVRWMGATGTNSYNWKCAPPNAVSCTVSTWEQRHTPNLAFYDEPNMPVNSVPFEHVLLAANELESDVWINVPATASSPSICRSDADGDHTKCINEDPKSTFEYQLALLFRDGNNFTNNVGLKPHLKIYVEHSNEVWNYGFKQHGFNQAFAEWEVLNKTYKRPTTNLDKPVPGHPDIERRQSCTNTTTVVRPGKIGQKDSASVVGSACWAKRRHARRIYEIAKTFEQVFGEGSLDHKTGRVRMVYASWGLEHNIQTYFNDTLLWLQAEYGELDKFMYGISYAQYFGPHSQNSCTGTGAGAKCTGGFNYSTATKPEVMQGFVNASNEGAPMTM